MRKTVLTWFDDGWGIDYNLLQDEDGSYFLSVNGQGHLPIETENAVALIEKHITLH